MEDYQQRVIDEKSELDSKRSKLISFMHTDAYAALPAIEQGILMVQLHDMDGYSETLGRRIEMFDGYPSSLPSSEVC